MIKINENGNVIVTVGTTAHNLADSEQYRAFLLWLTDPDESVKIPVSSFTIDQKCPPTALEKAKRYSTFLSEFAEMREKMIAEATLVGTDVESNKKAINELINSLKNESSS